MENFSRTLLTQLPSNRTNPLTCRLGGLSKSGCATDGASLKPLCSKELPEWAPPQAEIATCPEVSPYNDHFETWQGFSW